MSTPIENPFPIPAPENFNVARQAHGIAVPGSAKPGATPIYVNAQFPHLPTPASDPRFPRTAKECFDIGLASKPNEPCLGRRPWENGDWAKYYVWETYARVDQRRTEVGSGLVALQRRGKFGDGVPAKGYSVGIWSPNRPGRHQERAARHTYRRADSNDRSLIRCNTCDTRKCSPAARFNSVSALGSEWQWASQACSAYSLVTVSLYETLGPSVVEYCINHAEVRVVIAASDHIPALLQLGTKACPGLKAIISMDTWSEITPSRPGASSEVALKAWGEQLGITVLDIEELQALGRTNILPFNPPAPEDMASICYTSGTTGNPKGAILLHSSLASAAVVNLHGSRFRAGGIFISYLPLSHIYERFCEDVALAAGSSIGYHCGDNLRLLEDLAVLKPTFLVSVPRVLNRVYQAIKASTVDAPGFKGKMCRKAFADKLYNLEHHVFWDRIIFKKVKMALGGSVEVIGTGSAPINPSVLSFLKVALCCEVSEGYGQTENCGTAVKCLDGDHAPNGTVGPPQPGVEVKLIDVPDMAYYSTDRPFPRGEILTRGQMVIPGYLKDESKSKETVDSEGWLHSGDIGLIDELGRIKIIDRIKNLVKLSQGEYVAVEKVENVYMLCPLVMQIYVHADSLQDHVVGLVIPDPEPFAALATKVTGEKVLSSDGAAMEKASKDPRVLKAVAALLEPYAKQARLLKYEAVGDDIAISLNPFSMESETMTPTFKTKRPQVYKLHKDVLDSLYGRRSTKAVAKL
ncbi:BQ5605_C003g02185 [Microbotryum silenes-dioicae]|uniref:BQ5605_C003g02185 protein n=1 Tax=Microbotryum silenes-dioicae TaxID=796604 RepID=A0A2X0M115_9BASI|nr:BQ5605_C003g02185 [Microbotryum silenes-dioicae]